MTAGSMPTEDEMRAEFERQHHGRPLKRHHLRGTYLAPQIAALWNQHVRTARWMADDVPALAARAGRR